MDPVPALGDPLRALWEETRDSLVEQGWCRDCLEARWADCGQHPQPLGDDRRPPGCE